MLFPSKGFQTILGLVIIMIATTACVGIAPQLPGQGDDDGQIVVYRDTWGVPHIYAGTVEDGLYAQGWTQAEDRPEQLLLNYMMAMGEYSSVVGEPGIDGDLRARLFDHYGKAKRSWDLLDPSLQHQLKVFADGINDYYQAHPGDVPSWWQGRTVEAPMIIAFERFFLGWWTIHEAYNELQRGGVEPGVEPDLRGSNQFAIAPERSAEGSAILVIDPHLLWGDQYRFWEFRMHAGPWQASGVGLPGLPFVLLGHTRHIAWAMTTGGPDTADVYELTLSPEPDPDSGWPRYLFDGEWRELTPRQVSIDVKGAGSQQHTLWSSHHGPIIALHGDKAWAAKSAYQDATTANTAIWQLNMASDYTGAVRAMETLELFPQNIMVADTSGNIYYQRTGRVPRRPTGFDWSAPVDGSISATEWLGFHPSSDHLQVLNPGQGYMQNCNIPPDAMMPGSPFHLEDSTDYIFSSLAWGPSRDGWIGQRGARAIELLSQDDSVTAAEAIAYVNDVTVFGSDRWIEALRLADQELGKEFAGHENYQAGLNGLLSWDRNNTASSPGALKYDRWRTQLVEDHGAGLSGELASAIDDYYAIIEQREPRPVALSTAQQRMLTGSLATAMDAIVAQHGSVNATFGDHYRVGRDDQSWPLGGSGSAPGTIALRAMWYDRSTIRDGHTVRAIGGQSSTQVVVMSDPPQSWTYAPFGQSDREESPHFDDQAEKLFSPRQLRQAWWLPGDLAPHIESRTVLVR